MISKIALLSFILFAAIQMASSVCPADCIAGTTGYCIEYSDLSTLCSCSSGHADDVEVCDTPVNVGCTFHSIEDVETTLPTPVTSAYFDADILHVSISSPLVTERRYSTIVLDSSDDPENTNCAYPGLFWTRSFDDCNDLFQGSMPWATIVTECGWELDNSDPDDYIYKAELILTHHDFTNPFGSRPGAVEVERITDHVIPLQVRFPKNIELNTDATVTAPVEVLAAITRQRVNPLNREATIEVSTNVLWPYKLTNAAMLDVFPSQFAGYITISELTSSPIYNCPNTEGSSCTQVFRVVIDATDQCTITGVYKLDVDLDCQLDGLGELPAECAVDPAATASITMDILSESFCGTIDVDLDISGTLSSYYDGYSSARDFFLVNQVAYFQAVLTSENSTLTNAEVGEVVLVSGETELPLYDGTAALVPEAVFTLGAHDTDSAQFQFTLDDSIEILSLITEAEPRSITVRARIDVTYAGVSGAKRMYFESSLHQDVNLQSSIRIENFPQSGSAGSLLPSTIFTILLAVALSLAYVF